MEQKTLRILFSFDMEDKYIRGIRESVSSVELEIMKSQDKEKLMELIKDAEIVFAGRLTPEMFRAGKKLQWVHSSSAGVERLLFPELVVSSVILTNSRGIHPIQVSEHALGLMLCLVRGLHKLIRFQPGREWRHVKVDELWGKTIGVIGLGTIGSEIARKAKALGMTVFAIKKRPGVKPEYVDRLLSPEGLPELLSASDFVVVIAPLTKETEGMIGERELKLMKPTAYLINVARGKIVREADLIRALKEGWIAGAGLDVFEEEPLPKSSPLWDLENVIITPHMAGSTPYYWERATALFCENLKRFVGGKPLINIVDKRAGY